MKFLKLKPHLREREMGRELQQITDDERREKTRSEKSGCIYRRNPPSKEVAERERERESAETQEGVSDKEKICSSFSIS